MTTTKTLALIIDGDNAQLGSIKKVIRFCEVFGTLTIKQAYGDWEQLPLSAQRQTIIDIGVEDVQQERNAPNATDMRIAMEVGSILDKGEVDIYFIVSSDGDFTTVCKQICQKGAKVIGIGSETNTSSKLRKACTLFFTVEEITENLGKLAIKSSTVSKANNQNNVAALEPNTILKKLKQTYKKVQEKYGSVHLSQFSEALKVYPQLVNEKKPLTWLKDFPDQFEIEDQYIQMK